MTDKQADLNALAEHIQHSASADRFRLQRRWRELRQKAAAGKPDQAAVERLQGALEASLARVAERRRRLPVIDFPAQLPVSAKREVIAETIDRHQVVILAGETGSGKTTQLPKICLALGRGVTGMIGHTQPRRIAARTVASRIAEELQVPLGESVGYQVRFTDHATDYTHIKLMTDGILLAEIQHDRYLNRYDTLIIDEAHERSLNIDFLLGYLKLILPRRPELKVIITSATIDVERFSKHFDDAPIIEVSGRTYPVEVQYRPLVSGEENQTEAIVEAVQEVLQLERRKSGTGGDMLVFLSGERDIRETAKALREVQLPHTEILPLYARLSLAEQNKVFQSHRGRRIVLATNVAETSITVPGIRYVIDPGVARISRYSYRTKIQRLPVEPVSQASANQRKGRCGRVGEGVCIRLYDEQDFAARPAFTDAEILRTNLAAVILQMLHLRIGDIRRFPFVDPPDQRLINDGFKLLEELQAVDARGRLSVIGRRLVKLPVDPRLGRMLLAAGELGCVREMLIIASALAVQDPRERPVERQQAADEKHRRFRDPQSDFLAYLNLWEYAEQQRQALSQNQWRRQCRKEFLSYLRLREWRDIHYQLRLACKALDLKERPATDDGPDYTGIHRALLAGLLGNIGNKGEDREYLGARNRRFHIFPGSSQFKKTPKWLVAAQLLETSKLYAHTTAKIDPAWVLDAAAHLVKRQYFEPHYDARRGQVMAFEKISLYGLVLVEKRRIGYADIDPAVARDVFIRAALVEGNYRGKGSFFQANRRLLTELEELEAKSRRRDILVDDSVVFDFYAERVPGEVVGLTSFERWRKRLDDGGRELLRLSREHLMQHSAIDITEAQFPKQLEWEGMTLPLSYHFEPGQPEDGVSVAVPVSALHLVPEHRLEWLVPGLLRDKCIDLIKGLPKQWRKHFVPVPAHVDKALAGMRADNTPLTEALGHQLKRHTGVDLAGELWSQVKLEDFYRINIRVVDEDGHCIDQGRDLAALRSRYRDQLQQRLQTADNSIERGGIRAWDFGELPDSIELRRGGIGIRAYPALVDEGDSVAIRVQDNPTLAACLSHRGMVRLLLLCQGQSVKYLRRQLLRGADIGLSVAQLGNRDAVVDDLLCAACAMACLDGRPLPRDSDAFEQCLAAGRGQLAACANELEAALQQILTGLVEIKKCLKSQKNALLLAFAAGDINRQLQGLVYPGFLARTPIDWLRQYPRYFKAILLRLEKAAGNPQRDRLHTGELEQHWERYTQRLEQDGPALCAANASLQQYRWMIEELRVSFFAQSLKTLMPVSGKRLDKQWRETL
ncbi:ATP-dependent RNA helicase HrpA [Exilibacterium tricleocarpae]|uniref:ATP-dependent RNA helicase HrpA n=1 Tax=Exilibacterium tricleocarpae TaxID=2591008 RepID=A0A545TN92_9GAMM|nr:ATP-dependent RNA helicase HrpA [Exilibacterium tricleocarpae]TQV78700.1 ATP-dependent RNA helicase HrpA [Exilibacterium tricleocarpae]